MGRNRCFSVGLQVVLQFGTAVALSSVEKFKSSDIPSADSKRFLEEEYET